MIVIEIPPNPNCDAVDMRVFHDLESPHPVSQVRLGRDRGALQWYEVVAWTTAGKAQQALVHKVDDSGEGVAFLVAGGDAGLRLRPADGTEPWQLGDPQQWGLPFVLTTDVADLKFAAVEEAHG